MKCQLCGVNLSVTRGVHKTTCTEFQPKELSIPQVVETRSAPKSVSTSPPSTEVLRVSPLRSEVKFWGEIFWVSAKFVVLHVKCSRKRQPELSVGRLVFDRETWRRGVPEALIGWEIHDPENRLKYLNDEPEHAPAFNKTEVNYPERLPKPAT